MAERKRKDPSWLGHDGQTGKPMLSIADLGFGIGRQTATADGNGVKLLGAVAVADGGVEGRRAAHLCK